MDDLRVACIFAKVEFVRYESNMCTVMIMIGLEL